MRGVVGRAAGRINQAIANHSRHNRILEGLAGKVEDTDLVTVQNQRLDHQNRGQGRGAVEDEGCGHTHTRKAHTLTRTPGSQHDRPRPVLPHTAMATSSNSSPTLTPYPLHTHLQIRHTHPLSRRPRDWTAPLHLRLAMAVGGCM